MEFNWFLSESLIKLPMAWVLSRRDGILWVSTICEGHHRWEDNHTLEVLLQNEGALKPADSRPTAALSPEAPRRSTQEPRPGAVRLDMFQWKIAYYLHLTYRQRFILWRIEIFRWDIRVFRVWIGPSLKSEFILNWQCNRQSYRNKLRLDIDFSKLQKKVQ